MFTRLRRRRRDLGAKELGQSYNQPEHLMAIMNNYSTRPSALPFLTYIPAKIPLAVLRVSGSIHKVHSSAKAVLSDRRISSLRTPLETFKVESLIINE